MLDIIIVAISLTTIFAAINGGIRLKSLIISALIITISMLFLSGAIYHYDISYAASIFRLATSILLPWGFVSYIKLDNVRYLCAGAVIASAALTLISYLQIYGNDFALSLSPPLANISYIFGNIRPNGIWGHANENSIAISIGASFALLLIKDNRWKRYCFMYASIVIIAYFAILSRASLVTAAIAVSLVVMSKGSLRTRLSFITILSSLVFISIRYPETVWGARFTSNFGGLSIFEQGTERITTTIRGLTLSLTNLFGMLSSDRHDVLWEESNITATHNGIVYISMHVGVLITIPLLVIVLWVWLKSLSKKSNLPYHFPLTVSLTSQMFEDAGFLTPYLWSTSIICYFYILNERNDSIYQTNVHGAAITGSP